MIKDMDFSKNYQKIGKSEARKRMTDDEFKELEIKLEEAEITNRQIQEYRQIEAKYSAEVDKIPTTYQTTRIFRKSNKNQRDGIPDDYRKIFIAANEDNVLEDWQLSFPLLLLKATDKISDRRKASNSTTQPKIKSRKTLSFLRQTKRNLRYALKNQSKTKKIDFTPLGTLGVGGISKPLEGESQGVAFYYGNASTSQVYRNPIIQAFFEFSLNYSFIKHIELSFDEAKRIFSRACGVSLGDSLEKEIETQSFTEYLEFLYQGRGVLDHTNLPTYKPGRPSKPTSETERILELAKTIKSNQGISEALEPTFRKGSARRKAHKAYVGKTLRRHGIYFNNEKK